MIAVRDKLLAQTLVPLTEIRDQQLSARLEPAQTAPVESQLVGDVQDGVPAVDDIERGGWVVDGGDVGNLELETRLHLRER